LELYVENMRFDFRN